ncbi:MAG: hypothetical protein RLP11_06590, partial [Marinoscillum sp.]
MKQYVIPAIFSLIVGVVLWQIQIQRTELTYEIVESDHFPLNNGQAKFYIVVLTNTGDKEIENISVDSELKNATIEKFDIDGVNGLNISSDSSSLKVTIPLFNPDEQLKFTITAYENGNATLSFSARAKGVTAKPKHNGTISSFLSILISVITGLLAFFMITFFNRQKGTVDLEKIDHTFSQSKNDLEEMLEKLKNESKIQKNELNEKLKQQKEELEKEQKELEEKRKKEREEHEERMRQFNEEQEKIAKGKPERGQILFMTLNKNDLAHLYFKLINLGQEMTYLNTGFLLFMEYLKQEENGQKIHSALIDLSSNEMDIRSKGMIYYLIGKIESQSGNLEKVNYWFNKLKDEAPLLYEYLIPNDDHFDIKTIANWIKRTE